MAAPLNRQAHDQATSTGAAGDQRTGGKTKLTLFVLAEALDSANDSLEVALEVSPNGTNWFEAAVLQGATSGSDFSEDPANSGDYTAYTTINEYHEYVRARIKTYSDNANGDLQISSWIEAGPIPVSTHKGKPDG